MAKNPLLEILENDPNLITFKRPKIGTITSTQFVQGLSPGVKKIAAGLAAGELKKTSEEVKREAEQKRLEAAKGEADVFGKAIVKSASDKWIAFTVNGPATFTNKIDGTYSQKGFIGEEILVLNGVAPNHIGGITFKFLTAYKDADGIIVADSRHEEIIINKEHCKSTLKGFEEWLQKTWEEHCDEITAQTRKEVEEMENKAHEEAQLQLQNPLYGSW